MYRGVCQFVSLDIAGVSTLRESRDSGSLLWVDGSLDTVDGS